MTERSIWAVIMAGGGGTRLWPASRRAKPKQLLALNGKTSLLQDTRARLAGLVEPERILIVTSSEQAQDVQVQLPDIPPHNILSEPVGRNTLPCVAWAAAEIEARDANSLQMVLPADHVIEPAESFRDTLRAALEVADKNDGTLITLGIRPTFPATGFGYIEAGKAETEVLGHEVMPVQRFVEKPDQPTAEAFLKTGNYLWNSGAFIWLTSSIAAALETHASGTWQAVRGASLEAVADLYPQLEAVSVDVGLMEKANEIKVLPISYLWSDVGSWPAMEEVLPSDPARNHIGGDVKLIAEDASNNIIHGTSAHTIALLGVSDLVVVQTSDATLICTKERAQEIRRIVARLESEAPELM